MAGSLPLSALLSQALVAFTIEFDNEFEHKTVHRTTNHGPTTAPSSAPWLVSMAMWIKFLRFVPDSGITVREFQQLASLTNKEAKTWLTRMSTWWRYVTVQKNGAEHPLDWVIRPTNGGQPALQVWRPLTGIIEKRWEQRFCNNTVSELRQSMQSLVNQLNPQLPDYLPILGYQMLSPDPDPERRFAPPKTSARSEARFALPILLSKMLLALAIQYESESRVSIAISANVLRLANDEGIRVRDLPKLSGVSREAIAMAVKRLEQRSLATVRAEAKDSRVKVIELNAQGRHARDSYHRILSDLERRWESRFGSHVANLRRSLEYLAGESAGGKPDLFVGFEPYPDGWRASVRRPEVLPHYPMILHRGGFPDGS